MEKIKKEGPVASGIRTLLWEGEPVLSFSVPKLTLPVTAPRRVERYYRRLERMWRERWEGLLYQRACAAAQTARSRSRPFEPWSAGLTAEVSREEGVLRVRWEAAEQAEGRRCVLSREEKWQLPGGMPVLPPKRTGKKERKKREKFI